MSTGRIDTHRGVIRRTALVLILALAMWGIDSSRAEPITPIQIVWWHAMSGHLGDVLDQVVAKFNASQNRYQVVATNKGNYPATLSAALAAYRAGEPPHLFQNNELSVLTVLLSGTIMPVQEVLEQNGVKVDLDEYVRPVVDTYADKNGRLIAMPFNSSTPILFYNRDILAKAGIAAPPTTWQEMEVQLRKIRDTKAAECGYSFQAGPWQELENFSVYHDIPFASKSNGFDGLDAELMYNQTLAVKHIERLERWTKEGLAVFGTPGKATWSVAARMNFIDGMCAFWIDSSAWNGVVEDGAKMQWGAAPLPFHAGTQPNRSTIGGGAIYVFKGFKPEEYAGVAAFFKFLTDTDVQIFYHKATGYVPITVAAYQKAKADGYYVEKPSREVAVLQLLQGKNTDNSHTIRLGNFESVRAVVEEELDKVWAGELSAKQALDEGVRKGNEILRRYEVENRDKL